MHLSFHFSRVGFVQARAQTSLSLFLPSAPSSSMRGVIQTFISVWLFADVITTFVPLSFFLPFPSSLLSRKLTLKTRRVPASSQRSSGLHPHHHPRILPLRLGQVSRASWSSSLRRRRGSGRAGGRSTCVGGSKPHSNRLREQNKLRFCSPLAAGWLRFRI